MRFIGIFDLKDLTLHVADDESCSPDDPATDSASEL